MNARVPLYTGPTANPVADAARWDADQERSDEISQEAERQAPLIILAKLQAITKPGDWFNGILPGGRNWSPDEVLMDAVATDDDSMNAYVELLTGPHALKLRQCMAAWFGQKLAQDIYHEHQQELQ